MKSLLQFIFLLSFCLICQADGDLSVSHKAHDTYNAVLCSIKTRSFPQAIDFLKKGFLLDSRMKIPEKFFKPVQKLNIYNFLGILAARGGYYDDAVHFYECALQMVAMTDDASQLAVILENYAAILIRAQQYEKANEYLKLTIALYQRMHKELPAALQNNIGTSAFFQGEYEKALQLHMAACNNLPATKENLKEEEITFFYNVAWDFCALGHTMKAIDFLKNAERMIPPELFHSYKSRLIYLQAMVSSLEEVKKELAAEENESAMAQDDNIKTFHLLAHAEVSKRHGQWGDAAAHLVKALKLQHPSRLTSPTNTALPSNLQTYNARCMAIADAFAKANKREMAWFWVQQARNEAEKKTLIKGQTSELAEIFELEENLSKKQNDAEEIIHLELQYEKAKQKLKRNNSALWQSLFSQRVNIHPDDLDQIRHTLPQNAVLVETALIGDNVVFFVCERSAPVKMKIVPLPKGEKKIKKTILQFRQMISVPNNLPKVQSICNEFYETLFAPIEDDICRIKPDIILYSPAGILRYVPIAAFYSREQYLCERFLFCNLSGYDMLRLKEAEAPLSLEAFIGFANPDGTLPASEQECDGIRRMFPKGEVFRGAKATKTTFLKLQGKINCVHVATHGVLNPSEPEKSHLIFADQPLTYNEMTAGLPLMKNLYMLTFSSCNSAVISGLNDNALEIYGMAYQFIRKTDSGATMATLWPISDEHTNQFMTAFYKNLLDGYTKRTKMNRAMALNEAQCEMLKNKSTMHPFYWASFILIGNFN